MTTNEGYRNLLRRSLIAAGSCILAVVICYFWIDRSVAFFVYDHHINQIEVFHRLTYPPPEVQNWFCSDNLGRAAGVGTTSILAEGYCLLHVSA